MTRLTNSLGQSSFSNSPMLPQALPDALFSYTIVSIKFSHGFVTHFVSSQLHRLILVMVSSAHVYPVDIWSCNMSRFATLASPSALYQLLSLATLITRLMGQHGSHLGLTGPRWALWWPHELCYLGNLCMLRNKLHFTFSCDGTLWQGILRTTFMFAHRIRTNPNFVCDPMKGVMCSAVILIHQFGRVD